MWYRYVICFVLKGALTLLARNRFASSSRFGNLNGRQTDTDMRYSWHGNTTYALKIHNYVVIAKLFVGQPSTFYLP